MNVSKELPAPKDKDEKTIDAFIENKVRVKLKVHKSIRLKGKEITLSEDDGLKICLTPTGGPSRAKEGINTLADRRIVPKTAQEHREQPEMRSNLLYPERICAAPQVFSLPWRGRSPSQNHLWSDALQVRQLAA